GCLQRAFHPSLRVGVRLATDVERTILAEWIDDLFLHFPASDADVPAVPSAAEWVIAPITKCRVADFWRVRESMHDAELPRHFRDHALRRFVAAPREVRLFAAVVAEEWIGNAGELVMLLPRLMAARTQSVPEADVRVVYVAGPLHL